MKSLKNSIFFQGLNPGLAIGEIKKMLALYQKEAKQAKA